MTRLGCIRTDQLVERRAAGLSTAEALRLEEHLAGCERCSQQAGLLDQLRADVAESDGTLTPDARERAIGAALRSATSGARARPVAAAWQPWGAFAAVVTALALGFWLRGQWSANEAGPQLARQQAVPETRDRVVQGEVQIGAQRVGEGSPLQDGATLRSARGATIALAHATVELRPGTELTWARREHTLQLSAGSVTAEVDPRAHAPFAVATRRFTVQVIGTRFEVSPEGVGVSRGHVRVVAPDGRELARLGAGERFDASATASAPDPAASPDSVRAPAPLASARSATRSARSPQPDAATLLSQARTELAQRRIAQAREAIDAALAQPLAKDARAEALSLRAECALMQGDRAAAAAAYLRVANAFSKLPAGENALFAAARIEAERKQDTAAVRLLSRYLTRYPAGRFVTEANARLRALGGEPDAER